MYLAMIAHILLTIGILALYGFYIRKTERRRLSAHITGRMLELERMHDAERPAFGEPGHYATIRQGKIRSRIAELNEVAKWIKSV